MALRKIFIIRHAQSKEDIDPAIHNLLPDDQIGLTKLGERQTAKIIPALSPIIRRNDLLVCLSPSKRAIETYKILLNGTKSEHRVIIEKRVRNLNWGDINLENRERIEDERYKAGVLYYKFQGGDDSALYVRGIYDSVSELILGRNTPDFPEYILMITHGFALRVIVKTLTNMPDQDFRWLANPPNCFIAEVEAIDGEFVCKTKLPVYKCK